MMTRVIHLAIVLTLLGLIGIGLIVASTSRFGAGLTPDSVGYVATARHLAAGDGVVNFDGSPLVVQPPLYPALLAAFDYVFGIDPLSSARHVNALLFGLMIVLGGLLTWIHVPRSRAATVGVAVAILLSAVTIDIAVRAMSEPLFICLVVLSLIAAERYRTSNTMRSLVVWASIVALATLTRYIGVTLVLWGALSVLIWDRHSYRVRLLRLATFGIVAAGPLAVWLIRNRSVSGTLFGDRFSSAFSLSQNIRLVAHTVIGWYAPGRFGVYGELVVVAGLVVVGLLYFRQRRDDSDRAEMSGMAFVMLFVGVYAAFLTIASTRTAYDQIDDRLLLPLHIPVTMLLAIPIAAVVKRWNTTRGRTYLVAIVAIACVLYEAGTTASEIVKVHAYGRGYSSIRWVNSPVVQHIREHRILESSCPFYSNAPELAYLLSGRAAKLTPMKTERNSPDIITDLTSLQGTWPEEVDACLVWFEGIGHDFLFSVAELDAVADVRLLRRFDDGAIYTITRE
jgi:hypothetical protein